MPNINIALDIETLSLQPTAAIVSIAAETFHLNGQENGQENISRCFFKNVCLHSLFTAPKLTMDYRTLLWWREQPIEVKNISFNIDTAVTIKQALTDLKDYINDIREEYKDIAIWTEGTDFDIPILRHAYKQVLNEHEPWSRHELRDARTIIRMNDKHIPPYPDYLCAHNPNHDVTQLIWNITHIL